MIEPLTLQWDIHRRIALGYRKYIPNSTQTAVPAFSKMAGCATGALVMAVMRVLSMPVILEIASQNGLQSFAGLSPRDTPRIGERIQRG
jgi:hypothetical protein